MRYFKLPDLGEGLPEAEIVEWHVKAGDTVEVDQRLVSVETAKAIVDVPSPCAGTIVALFGAAGDMVHTGEPLVEFDAAEADTGTVVGKLQTVSNAGEDNFIIGAAPSSRAAKRARATPAVQALAKHLGVSLDQVKADADGVIRTEQVERSANLQRQFGAAEALRGVRRTMARNMALAHAQVVPVSLFDDVDIHDWPEGTDITMRLIRAIGHACQISPALNCWFDGETLTRRVLDQIHVGIAVDSPEGLFVPVLRDINNRSLRDLRRGLNRLREDVVARSIPPEEMQGATITLSNFGTIAGAWATPVVMPPQVAIVGAGRIREQIVAHQGRAKARRVMPLSVTFDHRAATGGEAARFLAALISALARKTDAASSAMDDP